MEPSPNKSLIALIKKAQGALTQNEFADKCGISSSNLTRIFGGRQKPTPELLRKIADTTDDPTFYEKLMTSAGYWEGSVKFGAARKGVFNHRLIALMGEQSLSASDLAKKSNLPTKEIENYITTNSVPEIPATLIKLAETLGVYADYLSGEVPYRNEEEREFAYQDTVQLSNYADRLTIGVAPELIRSLYQLFDTIDSSSSTGEDYFYSNELAKVLKQTIDGFADIFSSIPQYGKDVFWDDIAGKVDETGIFKMQSLLNRHDAQKYRYSWMCDNMKTSICNLYDKIFFSRQEKIAQQISIFDEDIDE